MVSVDVFYEAHQNSEACNNDLVNYSSYPIFLAKSCEDGSQTVIGVLTQNLHISIECDPEFNIKRNDYSEPEMLLPSDSNTASVPRPLSDNACLASKRYYY